jgi:hypothetical protein
MTVQHSAKAANHDAAPHKNEHDWKDSLRRWRNDCHLGAATSTVDGAKKLSVQILSEQPQRTRVTIEKRPFARQALKLLSARSRYRRSRNTSATNGEAAHDRSPSASTSRKHFQGKPKSTRIPS